MIQFVTGPRSPIRFASTVAVLLLVGLVTGATAAPLTGTLNIPGDYATLDAAITDLNAQGVGAGGVTLNLVAGNPETAPAGGYVIGGSGSLVLTTSSSSNPITLQGNSNTITASAAHTVGALNDAVFKLIGADWITITGFTLQENSGNTVTTPASNNMTEWAIALLYVTTSDGSQNNTIQGNTISLNRSYTNTWGVYSNVRHSPTAVGTTADIVNNTTAPHSGNKVYGNAISNVNMGIAFIGSGTAANQDVGNDVGGGSSSTGNTLSNWGGAAAASTYVSNSGTSYCIFMNHQTGENASYNSVTSASVSGTSVTFRGILKDYTTAAPTGTFTSSVTNNTVTLTSGFTSGTFEAIRSQGMTALSTATINLNNNTILNCAVTGASSSSAIIGIVNSSAPGTLSISNNIIRGSTSTATTGGFTGLSNTGAAVTTINLNNNQVGNASGGAITFSAATSGTVTGITNSGGASTSAVSIQGNDIRGITHSVAGSSTHTYITNTAATLSQNISTNTFTNLTVATTGSATFIANSVTAPSGGSKTINSNSIVTAYSKTGAGGTLTLYSDNASSVTGVVVSNNSNNFSNITVTGATTIAGWSNTDGGQPTKTIQSNTFSNWTGGTNSVTVMNLNFGSSSTTTATLNTISGISGGGAVTGMVLGSSIGTANATQNTINTLSSTGASAVQGMTSASATSNLLRNKIYDLAGSNASTTVNGVLVSAGTTVTVANNLIGDLRATAASAAGDVVRGISITSATSSSSVNVYFNSIYLAASSSGANFSTTGLFHTASATSTTAALSLRNNVVVNASTPNGTGLVAALRRSGTSLANYASTSNNNLLYAGTPGATRLIYYDGTNSDQTIGGFRTRVSPRDANSVTENPPFLSTTGSSANFLHIDPSIATQIESGAQTISGITDDFDGQVRSSPNPDIGGDEGSFTPADLTGPSISYSLLGGSTLVTTRSFSSVTITDPSGVNGTAGTSPRVYYKRSIDANAFNDNGSGTDGWKFAESNGSSSPFDFTIDYSRIFGGSVTAGDVIQYFVVAQDLASTPNVGINSGSFAAQPTSVALTSAAFPIGGTINSYSILTCISGTKTVGSGGDYATLKAAFDAINAAVVCADIQLTVLSSGTTETAAATLNNVSYEGGPFTITIKPDASTTPTITGNIATAVIVLNGADNVVIDGSNSVSGTTRDLKVTNTNTSTTSAVIWLQTAASGSDPASRSDTVKHVQIEGSGNTQTLIGVGSGSTTISTTSLGTGNNNNTVQNCSVSKTQYGIYSQGASAGNKNTGNAFTQNAINTSSPNNVAKGGILLGFENNVQVTRNLISGMSPPSTFDAFGIALGLTSWTTTTFAGNEVTNATVTGNNIGSVVTTTTYSAAGINLASATSGTTLIANNMISGVSTNGTSGDFGAGIFLGGGTGSTTRVYHNSVSMSGTQTGGSYPNIALAVGGSIPVVDIQNNALSNTQTTGTGKSYAIALAYSSTAGNYANLTSNNNDLYVATGATFFVGETGALNGGTDRATIAAWNTETGRDASPASFSENPPFTSSTDLHLLTSVTTLLESGGTPLASVTTDYDGDARNPTTPDVGADEGGFMGIPSDDIAAIAFIEPPSGGSKLTGEAFAPQASFKNNGRDTQTGVTVRYRIVGPSPSTAEVYNQTATIASIALGETKIATFPTATVDSLGTYAIYAKAELAGDEVPANDEISGTLSVTSAPLTWDGGASTTNWSDAANWNPDGVPTAASNVDLNQGSATTIDVDGNFSINNLSVGANVTLNMNGNTLTVGGTHTQTGSTVNCNTGTLSVAGFTVLSGGTLNANSGTMLAMGNFTLSGGAVALGTGTLEVRGAFLRTSGTFTADTGTTVFSGSATQSIGGGVTHNNLVMRNGGAGLPKSLTAAATFATTGDLTVESTAQLALSAATATTMTIAGNLNYSGVTGGANIGSLTFSLTGSGKTINGAAAFARGSQIAPPEVETVVTDMTTDLATAAVLGMTEEGKPVYALANTLAQRQAYVEELLATADPATRQVILLDDATIVRNPSIFQSLFLSPSLFEMAVTIATNAGYTLGDNISIAAGKILAVNGRLNCGVFTISGAGGVTVTGASGSSNNGVLGTATASAAGLGATILTTGTNTYASDPIIEYNAAGPQTVNAANHPANAMVYTAGSGTKTLDANKTLTGNSGSALTKAILSVGAGSTFADGGFRLAFTTNLYANVIVNGAYSSSGAGSISYETVGAGIGPYDSNVLAVDGTTFGDVLLNFPSATNNDIDLDASGAVNWSFRNVICGGTAGAGTLGGTLYLNETGTTNVTVTGNVSLTPTTASATGGGFQGAASTTGSVTVLGNVTSTSTAATQPIMGSTGTNTLTMGGSSVQTLSLAVDASLFSGATLRTNNAAGVSLAGAATVFTVGGTLNLASGNVTTGAKTLAIGASGAVVRTGGHVEGRLQKNVATGAPVARTFEVGTGTGYAPVDVTFASVGTAGTVTAMSTAGDHPDLGTSDLDANKTANRYWTVTNGGVVFTTADATLNFVAGDLDGSANPLAFVVRKYDAPTWSSPATGTVTSTSTQATGLTSFSDFAVGEIFVLTHAITASAGAGGSIDPSGIVTVPDGSDTTFTITADSCHTILSVVVDGSSVGAVGSYTFTDVVADHTISATFAVKTYKITASAGAHGSISPSGAVFVNCGMDTTFTITPSTGYHVANVLVDGVSVGAVTSYTFTSVAANHTIAASFAINTYTINASAGAGGSITPSGAVVVAHGDSVVFTITADPGFAVGDVQVDSSSVGAVTSYTFLNVTANHTIEATFDDMTSVAEVLLGLDGVLGVYPNPSGIGQTNVLYRVLQTGPVSVIVYDIGGRMVRQLESGVVASGVRGVTWDGRDENGSPVAPGMFFVRFTSDSGQEATKRLMIIQ